MIRRLRATQYRTHGMLAGSSLLSCLEGKHDPLLVDVHCEVAEKSHCRWTRWRRAGATVQQDFDLPSD